MTLCCPYSVCPYSGLLVQAGEVRALELTREPRMHGLRISVGLPGPQFRLDLWEQDGLGGMFRHLFSQMREYLADQSFAWAQARPECPGHEHPARLLGHHGRLCLVCPADLHLIRPVAMSRSYEPVVARADRVG